MREIKFRAWDRGSRRMIEWHHVDMTLLLPDNGMYYDLMQFTGLLDRNGKEIYEGDVVKGPRGNHPVEFVDGSFCVKDHDDGHWAIRGRNSWFEVIGSIYENPELLEVKP